MPDSVQTCLSHPYLDTSNPQHFINLVPDAVQHAIYQIPYEWFELEESAVVIKAFGKDGNIPDVDAIYRLNFWEAYSEKFEKAKHISYRDIVGSSSTGYLKTSILTDPARTLFLITEPTKIKSATRFVHHLALKNMIETLKMPILHNSRTGLPDAQLIAVKQKIFEYIDQRMHGSIIQRQQISSTSQNLNVNVEAAKEDIAKLQELNNLEVIDARIKELEAELESAPAVLPPAIEVIPDMDKVKTVLPASLDHKENN